MKRTPANPGEHIIRPGIVVPDLGPTAGDADLCREYGIPEVSLDQDLAVTTAAQEATLLALAAMPGQRFDADNAGGIMRQALGIEKGTWGNSLNKLSSLAILEVSKPSPQHRISTGLHIDLPVLAEHAGKSFYTPRLGGVLESVERYTEPAVLQVAPAPAPKEPKKADPGLAIRRVAIGNIRALTIEPPVTTDEKWALHQAGIVFPDRWLKLKGKQAELASAFSFTPGELGDQPSETMAQTAFLIATVLGSNRGAITIDGEPHDPNKTRGWGVARVDSPHLAL